MGIGASDLHGSLTGYLCGGGGSADARHWLDALELAPEEIRLDASQYALFERLYADCAGWLEDPELGFEPLLPAADAALDTRADALIGMVPWFSRRSGPRRCRQRRRALSDEAKEILRDFAAIAGTRFEYSDAEEDENALTEVIEFIRVGALLLHAELHATPRAGATLH